MVRITLYKNDLVREFIFLFLVLNSEYEDTVISRLPLTFPSSMDPLGALLLSNIYAHPTIIYAFAYTPQGNQMR